MIYPQSRAELALVVLGSGAGCAACHREGPRRGLDTGYDGGGQVRDGVWVAEITGMLDLSAWPAGMRVIVRKERPHPGAQLRLTDVDGHRFTCFVTGTTSGQLADLELRHRRRARCEDPHCQGHRAAESPAARLRPEPDLVRDRRPGLRTAGLDPDARVARPGAGNPKGSACGSSPSPGGSCAAAGGYGSGWPNAGHGPRR